MNKAKFTLIVFFFIVLLALAGCGAEVVEPEIPESAPPTPHATQPVEVGISDVPQPELAGTSWQMTTVNGRTAVAGTNVTATFTDVGTIEGSGGCNTYNFTYETGQPNFITVETGMTTLMACDAPVMEQETQYFRALDDAATYIVEGETLTLTSADGSTIVTYQKVAEATLAGTSWQVIAYNNGADAVVSVMAETTVTAVFNEDGTISGSTGCNSYGGTYETMGSDISIEILNQTMMACGEAVTNQESAFLAAIQTAVTYRISGDTMEMRDANDAIVANFATGLEMSLANVVWNVISYNDDNEAIVSPLAGSTLTAQFSSDGTVTGNTGCGEFTAAYTVNGNQITIGQPNVNRQVECNQEQITQETEYTNALATAATFTLQGNQLQLLNEAGSEAVTFEIVQ